MKVNVVLKVKPEEFYNLMMESLEQEIKVYGKKNMTLKEGVKYKKKSSQRQGIGSEITVYIKKLIPNKLYVSTYTTSIDHTEMSYAIEKLEESKIRVTYEEIYENVSSKEIPAWKQKMAEKKSAKNAKRMLGEVEKFILNKRAK